MVDPVRAAAGGQGGRAGEGGQVEVKDAAFAPPGNDVDLAAHRLDQTAADRQADASARDAALGGVEPLERREQPGDVVGTQARAAVGHDDPHGPRVGPAAPQPQAATLGVVFDPVGKQVEEHLVEPPAVGAHQERPVAPAGFDDLDTVLPGQGLDELGGGGERLAGVHRFEVELHVAGLDAGDVEHLVDEVEQVPAPLEDLFDAGALRGRQVFEVEQLAEAQDGVERRAQLMAHAGKELALGAVRLFGFLLGRAHGFLGVLEFGHVEDHAVAVQVAVGLALGAGAHDHPAHVAVRQPQAALPMVGGERGGGSIDGGVGARAVLGVDGLVEEVRIRVKLRRFQAANLAAALAHERHGDAAVRVADRLVNHPGRVAGDALVARLHLARRRLVAAAGDHR